MCLSKGMENIDLSINRSNLWRTALGFYKNCMVMPERLRWELRIKFDDEEGVDAGALSYNI